MITTSEVQDQKTFGSMDLCELTGMTYRQLDYWCRTGLIEASIYSPPTSGKSRVFSEDDLWFASIVKKMLNIGISLQRIREAAEPLRGRREECCGKLFVLGETGGVVLQDVSEVVDFLTSNPEPTWVMPL